MAWPMLHIGQGLPALKLTHSQIQTCFCNCRVYKNYVWNLHSTGKCCFKLTFSLWLAEEMCCHFGWTNHGLHILTCVKSCRLTQWFFSLSPPSMSLFSPCHFKQCLHQGQMLTLIGSVQLQELSLGQWIGLPRSARCPAPLTHPMDTLHQRPPPAP